MTTIQYGLPIARIELLDAVQIKACNAYSKLDLKELPTLFVEFHGSENNVKEQADLFTHIIADFEGTDFAWDTEEAKRKQLWTARHNAYHAARATSRLGQLINRCVCADFTLGRVCHRNH